MILTDLSTCKPKVTQLKNGPYFKIEIALRTQTVIKWVLILFNSLYLKMVICQFWCFYHIMHDSHRPKYFEALSRWTEKWDIF